MAQRTVDHDGVHLAVHVDGEGPPVVLLHGLTATHRYVVMGSRALPRAGFRTVAYDARGHGDSSPAPDRGDYGYEALARDLWAVLDDLEIERATFAGVSMGAHTLLHFALEQPERAAALVVVTPAFVPEAVDEPARAERWHALAAGLRDGGVEGFMEAYGTPKVPESMREPVLTVVRQRLERHAHPEAVADALDVTPFSRPFESLDELAAIDVPTVVVASRDEADPEHPYAVGAAYAEAIPGARLQSEEPGRSPLAWQGAQLSKVIAEVARAGAAAQARS
jgi:pimeloyl-ACP methyl ester carboxylesterase